jgi:hypothetical protein
MKMMCIAKQKEVDVPQDCQECEYLKIGGDECGHREMKKQILRLGLISLYSADAATK